MQVPADQVQLVVLSRWQSPDFLLVEMPHDFEVQGDIGAIGRFEVTGKGSGVGEITASESQCSEESNLNSSSSRATEGSNGLQAACGASAERKQVQAMKSADAVQLDIKGKYDLPLTWNGSNGSQLAWHYILYYGSDGSAMHAVKLQSVGPVLPAQCSQ